MNRPFLALAFFAAATAALAAQEATQSNPYQGTSNPPPDDTILTDAIEQPQAKPPAAHPMQPAAPAQQTQSAPAPASATQPAPAPSRASSAQNAMVTGTDDGIVQVAPPAPASAPPDLSRREPAPDPDGDIVHPAAVPAGTLAEGTMIRMRLLNDLSTSLSEKGEAFRGRVASDVLQDGNVVIPAGSEVSGRVVDISTGHFGGEGSMMLRPETVTLPNGEAYKLHAMVAGTPGSDTRVDREGQINPGSTLRRDSIEYAGVAGGGAIAGAFMGGPVGALAGGLVGAAVITTHLLVSHPQVHLDSGTVMMLTLTEPMHMEPAHATGN